MEEVDELRAKAIASMAGHTKSAGISPHKKEEGELSSSEGEGIPSAPATHCTSNNVMSTAELNPVGQRNRLARGAGKPSSVHISPSNSAEMLPPILPERSSYNLMTKRMHTRPRARPIQSRYVSSDADNNLVINFDESESDSENNEDGRSISPQGKPSINMDTCKKPTAMAQKRSSISSHIALGRQRVMSAKVPSNRVFVPSSTKSNKNNVRVFGTAVRQISQLQKSNAANRFMPRQITGVAHGTKSTNLKLENLRQQIAIREHELKRKLVPQSKERPVHSDDGMGVAASEPEVKRFRVSVSSSDKLENDCQPQLLSKGEAKALGDKEHGKKPFALIETTHSGVRSSSVYGRGLSSISQCGDNSKQHQTSMLVSDFHESDNQGSKKQANVMINRESDTAGHDPIVSVKPVLHGDNLLQYLVQSSVSEPSAKIGIQSLLKIEELQDRELEEAQEMRRKCELEERAALKAYRDAQRALIDANNKCTYLYGQRELLSAKIRAFALEGTSSSWPSRWPKFESFRDIASSDDSLLHKLSPQIHDHEKYRSDIEHEQPVVTSQHFGGTESGAYNQVSEPDGSTSEVSAKNTAKTVFTSTNLLSFSAEEEETNFPSDKDTALSDFEKDINTNHQQGLLNATEKETSQKSAIENEDFELLEASLRSKLFARLGPRKFGKSSCNVSNKACSVDVADTNNIVCEKDVAAVISLPVSRDVPLPEKQRKQMALSKDVEGIGGTSIFYYCDKSCSDDVSLGSTCVEESSSHKLVPSMSGLPSELLRTVFRHLNVAACRKDGTCYWKSRDNEEAALQHILQEATLQRYAKRRAEPCIEELAIDPLWPLCMFELRGKCNNDTCILQHERDYRNHGFKNRCTIHCDGRTTRAAAHGEPTHRYEMPAPTYMAGLNIIKAKPCSSVIMSPYILRDWWSVIYSAAVVPFPVERLLRFRVPCLGSAVDFIGIHESWSRPSFHRKINDGTMAHEVQSQAASEHAAELALEFFNKSSDKQEEMRKALAVLSRALEADPKAVVLWVVYLHIFYRKVKTLGKDDMFLVAVQHNECSYELWLMYINSRLQFNDRLEAYDDAMKAFVDSTNAPLADPQYASSCLLDLCLQLMSFLCMSGNADIALSEIRQLYYPAYSVSSRLSIRNVLDCLSVSDKSTLWVCLIYILMYKQLPKMVTQRLEFEQVLPFGLEWPPTQLEQEEKDQALKLIKLSLDSISEISKDQGIVNETMLHSAYLLAITHIKCAAVLEGAECSLDLLLKYKCVYPECPELSLMWARLRDEHTSDGSGFTSFEEVLCDCPSASNWTNFLWNQYAEFALDHGEIGLAEKLINRWFETVWKAQSSEETAEDSYLSVESSDAKSSPFLRDGQFALINVALHHLLCGNQVEAEIVIDKMLHLATSAEYSQCAQSHASFWAATGSRDLEDHIVYLVRYLMDARVSNTPEPLSWRFVRSIKRPKLRPLIESMLCPVSPDPYMLNSILQVLYGPSLLPEISGKFNNLVDFVEALILIQPANYQLTLSVCRHIQSLNLNDVSYSTTFFWANALLVNSIIHTFPVAPEWAWVESATILTKMHLMHIVEWFHEVAVSIYPFSLELWQSYINISRSKEKCASVLAAAQENGLKLC